MFDRAPILVFQGRYRFLSNFWPASIAFDGALYPTVEHAYQAAKTQDPVHRATIGVLKSPGEAKRYARQIVLRSDWEAVRIGIMFDLVKRKFIHHEQLGLQLIDTRGSELVEGNTWGDKFWGRCGGQGLNMLGRILMQVRVEIAP